MTPAHRRKPDRFRRHILGVRKDPPPPAPTPEPAVPPLACGCPGDSNVTYRCLYCPHTLCSEHRERSHICPGVA